MKQSIFLLRSNKLSLFNSVQIYFYGIFISLGVFLGYFFSKKRAKKNGIKEEILDSVYLLLIPFSVLGARIYHVLSWLSYYLLFPREVFSIRNGGLGIFGSIIFGILALFLFCKIKKQDFILILDLISPSILLSQAIGRVGNFFNQEAFGPPTDLPWKFYVSPDKRPIEFISFSYFHPTFFYEAILCILAFLIILVLEKNLKPAKGFSSGSYLFSYGLIRFFTEFLRFDTWKIFGFKMAQVISVMFVGIGLYLIKSGMKGQKLIK